MADHSDEPTATEELAAAMRQGAKIQPVSGAAGVDAATGLAPEHDDRSPLDHGMPFDPTSNTPDD